MFSPLFTGQLGCLNMATRTPVVLLSTEIFLMQVSPFDIVLL